jgi:hypothetical protein
MAQSRCTLVFACFLVLTSTLLLAQNAKPGILSPQDLKKTVPSGCFFHGQSAPVQLRNSAGLRTSSGQLFLAGLVDTSGYSTDLQQKYQGFVITETKVNIDGSELAPGQYGFGFTPDGKFVVMNVAGVDLFSVTANHDDQLKHPVPLRIVEEGGQYRLYAGKKWVSIKPE